MAVLLGIRRRSRIQKIAWLNDSPRGIYCGVLAGEVDLHMSYHVDGNSHTKINGATLHEELRTPLFDFAGHRQLVYQAFAIPEHRVAWPPPDAFRSWGSFLLLDDYALAGADSLGISIWLFDSALLDVVDQRIAQSAAARGNCRDLVTSYQRLDAFPNLTVGLAFEAVRHESARDLPVA